MEKSADAFRTISEVAEVLETPAHVLRFWESRFPQIRPVKRAGGRRYYRPADVALLAGIRRLLHDEGMTIRGVQKILREQGVRHVSGLTAESAGPSFRPSAEVEDAELVQPGFTFEPEEAPPERAGQVLPFVAPQVERPAPAPLPAAAEAEESGTADMQVPAAEADEPALIEAPVEDLPEVSAEAPEEPVTTTGEPVEALHRQEEAATPLSMDIVDRPASEPAALPDPAPPEALPPAELAATGADSRSPADAEEEAADWLPARLRALPQGALAGRRETVLALQARLQALRERLALAHRGGRR